jgi:hypothetical protein
MNSAEELSKYKESVDSYYSPTLSKRLLGYGYDLPEKSPKKDKKWSIGSLFRRKKKDESDSTSDEDSQKKSFLGRKKRKAEKKKKAAKSVGTFDHVVLSRNSHLYSNGFNGYEEPAIFSDPTGFNGYAARAAPKAQVQDTAARKPAKNASLDDVNTSRNSLVSGSSDVATKKNRKGLAKVRAEGAKGHFETRHEFGRGLAKVCVVVEVQERRELGTSAQGGFVESQVEGCADREIPEASLERRRKSERLLETVQVGRGEFRPAVEDFRRQ